MSRYDLVDLAYDFLVSKEKDKSTFTVEELSSFTTWKPQSCKTYLSKLWFQFVQKNEANNYSVSGINSLSKDDFRDLHSQKIKENKDFSQQGLLITKAKGFALLAVSSYNNPFFELKTHAFIVNIVIAYTALFHAIFTKNSIDYFHKDKFGKNIVIDGDEKAWELKECCIEFWKSKLTPERANLEFLIGLRNKIEHRNLPHIDLIVAGYCQAALSNFEEILVNEFGAKHALLSNLAISMQLTKVAVEQQIEAMKAFQKENYQEIKEFMETFNNDLNNTEILDSQKYRIRVFLIPKIGNALSSADLAIDFVNANNLTEEELARYEHAIALIKGVELPYKLKPGKIVSEVKKKYPNFNMSDHTALWKKHKARPHKNKPGFKGKYAAFIEGFDGYLYSKEWVYFILEKLNQAEKAIH